MLDLVGVHDDRDVVADGESDDLDRIHLPQLRLVRLACGSFAHGTLLVLSAQHLHKR